MSDLLSRPSTAGVDPRGPRFGAWITAAVLAVVLLTGSLWLLAAQVVVFALGAAGRSPYGPLWKKVRAYRQLPPPEELEAPGPLRFAQLVGLVFALAGLLGAGSPLTYVAVAGALVAALLNAAYGVCLGCSLYLSYVRLTHPDHSGGART